VTRLMLRDLFPRPRHAAGPGREPAVDALPWLLEPAGPAAPDVTAGAPVAGRAPVPGPRRAADDLPAGPPGLLGLPEPALDTGPAAVTPAADEGLVLQLQALYDEKCEVHAALGVSTAAEIVELARAGGAGPERVESAVALLHAAYDERALLQAGLGCSSAPEVIALVGDLRAHLASLSAQARGRIARRRSYLERHGDLLG